MNYHVRNIPVNKYFSGLGSGNFIRRYAAVTAPDPQELWSLNSSQCLKVFRVIYFFLSSPGFIFKQ